MIGRIKPLTVPETAQSNFITRPNQSNLIGSPTTSRVQCAPQKTAPARFLHWRVTRQDITAEASGTEAAVHKRALDKRERDSQMQRCLILTTLPSLSRHRETYLERQDLREFGEKICAMQLATFKAKTISRSIFTVTMLPECEAFTVTDKQNSLINQISRRSLPK